MSEIIFKFPENIKNILKKPIGTLYKNVEDAINLCRNKNIVCVGDVVFLNLIRRGILPKLAIIDFKTKRIKKIEIEEEILKKFKVFYAKNPPSTLTKDIYEKISNALSYKHSLIIVDGEEDLTVIACLLICDESYVILYGQPDEGVVLVKINEETLEKISFILNLTRIFE